MTNANFHLNKMAEIDMPGVEHAVNELSRAVLAGDLPRITRALGDLGWHVSDMTRSCADALGEIGSILNVLMGAPDCAVAFAKTLAKAVDTLAVAPDAPVSEAG